MKNSERRFKEIKEEMALLKDSGLKLDYIDESIFHYTACKHSTIFSIDRSLWLYYAQLVHNLTVYRAMLLTKVGKSELLGEYLWHKQQQTLKF